MQTATPSSSYHVGQDLPRLIARTVLVLVVIGAVIGCDRGPMAPRPDSLEGGDPFVLDVIRRTADAVDRASANPKGWTQLGELYFAHDQFDSALECYGVAIELDPDDSRLRYLRAVCRKRIGDVDGAFEDVEIALSAGSVPAQISWRAALWYLEEGDVDRAERLATDAMKNSRGDRNSRRVLARVAMEAGRPEEALTLLGPIVRKRPDDRETRTSLVTALRMTGDLDAAARQAALAGDARPNYFDPWLDAVVTRRTDLPFWIRRAQRTARKGDPEAARIILETVLERWYPEARELRFTEGVILVEEGRHEEAAALFEELVAGDPSWAQAMMQGASAILATSMEDADRRSVAKSLLERCLVLEPARNPAKVMLSRILEREGDPAAARRLMEQVVASETWIPGHRNDLARLQRATGDPATALGTLDEATGVFGPRLGIELGRATVLIDLGRSAEAAAALARARKISRRPTPEILEIEARLAKESSP